MKKLLMFFGIALPFFITQGIYAQLTKLEYFYDNDPGYGLGTGISISPNSPNYASNLTLPTSGLSLGLHTLNLRAQDATGSWSHTHIRSFLFLSATAGNSTSLSHVEYFIDTDPGFGNGTQVAFPAGTTDLGSTIIYVDLSSISEGLHVFYARVKTQTDVWSMTLARSFIKLGPATTQVTALEYYFDTDPGVGSGTPIPFTPNPGQDVTANVDLNLTGLSEGRHRIYVRAKDNLNKWSVVQSAYFDISQCPPTVNLSSTSSIPNGIVQASQTITAANKVQTGMNLVYKAGESILLQPGFEAGVGVVFKAYIGGCN
jgi:hypothetical protein